MEDFDDLSVLLQLLQVLPIANGKARQVRGADRRGLHRLALQHGDIPVLQCETVETTAIGAAYLAGLAVGYWEDLEELEQNAQIVKVFHPHMSAERRESNLAGWRDAVKRSLNTAQ